MKWDKLFPPDFFEYLELYKELQKRKYEKIPYEIIKTIYNKVGPQKTLTYIQELTPKQLEQLSWWIDYLAIQKMPIRELKKFFRRYPDKPSFYFPQLASIREYDQFLELMEKGRSPAVILALFRHPKISNKLLKRIKKLEEKIKKVDDKWETGIVSFYRIVELTNCPLVYDLIEKTLDHATIPSLLLDNVEYLLYHMDGFVDRIPELLKENPKFRSYILYKMRKALTRPTCYKKRSYKSVDFITCRG